MGKYNNCSDWHKFQAKILKQMSKKEPYTTEIFDYHLFKGGGVKDIHKNGINLIYKTPGYLFDRNGQIQARTLFGHIADRIFTEKCIIKINGITITRETDEEFLLQAYAANHHIKIEGFKGEKRPDSTDDSDRSTDPSLKNYLPTKSDVELAISQLPLEMKENIPAILDQVEKNALVDGKQLKENWRIITERNIKEIWFK